MKWIGLVCLCLWTLCSGAPQDCSGYGGCDMEEVDPDVTTPVPGSTTTPEPDTGDLARQQDLRAPIPISPDVAFSVRKAATRTAPGRVRFQNLLSNVGGAWRSRNSQFVAPYSGGYFFIFHAVSHERRDFTMALIRNGRYQVTAYGALDGYQHGSNSAFLVLRRGDRIHLELQQGSIYEHPRQEAYTSFTGFMLFRN